MKRIDLRETKAIKKLKALHEKHLAEIRALRIKQIEALEAMGAKLGIDVNKAYKKEVMRKLVHLSSLWIPALIYLVPIWVASLVFGVILLLDVFLEYSNFKKYTWARKTFGLLFFKTLRNKERNKKTFQVSGCAYVMMASILCLNLFSKEIAIISLSVMLISDTVAALIGRAYGTRKLRKSKSLEGTSAFFLSALFVQMAYNHLFTFTYVAVLASFFATLVEMYEDKLQIDDNLSIALVTGAVLTLL